MAQPGRFGKNSQGGPQVKVTNLNLMSPFSTLCIMTSFVLTYIPKIYKKPLNGHNFLICIR